MAGENEPPTEVSSASAEGRAATLALPAAAARLGIRGCAARRESRQQWHSQLELRGPITWHKTRGLCQAKL